MELVINWAPGTPDGSLLGFPYKSGQYIDREGDFGGQPDVGFSTAVDLGEHEDAIPAQEQFLNSCEWVVSFEVRER